MHFKFINSSNIPHNEIIGSYDLILVILSITVASIASYTAFILTRRIHNNNKLPWLLAGSLIQGTGIWSMHFIGMLAFKLPGYITVSYDPLITAISVLPAVLASFVVFRTNPKHSNILINSVLMGLGIGSMHYIGMSGMRMNAMMMYDPWLFSLSLLLAIILAYIALRLKIWATESTNILILFDKNFIIASIAMGIAISAMHYTAMMATHHYPGAHDLPASPAISHDSLAWLIGAVTAIIFLSLVFVIRLSDRHEALQIIRENEARINSIINNASDGIISIDKSGIIEIFNTGAESIFGYTKHEVIGQDVSILLLPKDQENHKQYVRQSKLHEPRILNNTRELTGRKKNGDEFPIEVNISPIDFSGKSGYVGMVRDITERKNNELELIRAKELAESSNKAKMEFISSMSHELHTPLNSIIGFAQILNLEQSGPINEAQKKNIDYIEDAGNKLLSIINNIIDLSSIEKHKTTLNFDSINIHNLIDECLVTIRTDLNHKNINLTTNYNKCDNSFVYADYIKLKKVILNLLSNACKFNHHNGEIRIQCKLTDNSMLKVSVTDNGIGISDDQIKNLFKPFNRLGLEGGNIEGTGIGLTISMQLIELMNGHIGAESTINRGSTFWFEIPVYK